LRLPAAFYSAMGRVPHPHCFASGIYLYDTDDRLFGDGAQPSLRTSNDFYLT